MWNIFVLILLYLESTYCWEIMGQFLTAMTSHIPISNYQATTSLFRYVKLVLSDFSDIYTNLHKQWQWFIVKFFLECMNTKPAPNINHQLHYESTCIIHNSRKLLEFCKYETMPKMLNTDYILLKTDSSKNLFLTAEIFNNTLEYCIMPILERKKKNIMAHSFMHLINDWQVKCLKYIH